MRPTAPLALLICSTRPADCSGVVSSTFDVEELTSDEISSARCSVVGAGDSAMGDCSGGNVWRFSSLLIFGMFLFVF